MLGTDRQTAQAALVAAVVAAVPTLLAGMHKNAQAYEGAARLEPVPSAGRSTTPGSPPGLRTFPTPWFPIRPGRWTP